MNAREREHAWYLETQTGDFFCCSLICTQFLQEIKSRNTEETRKDNVCWERVFAQGVMKLVCRPRSSKRVM